MPLLLLYAILAGTLVVTSLLPLWRHDAWWIRIWDFPRLQLASLGVVLLVGAPLVLERGSGIAWALPGVVAICVVYQAWWIVPYTRFFPEEVPVDAGGDPANRIAILAVNVLTPNRNAPALLEMIRAWRPDVVVAVETDLWWQSRLDALEAEYPHAQKCPLDNLYGMHLYSRLPLEDVEIQFLVEEDIPSIHTVVVLPSGRRIRLHCLHPTPPSPTENPDSSERDAELVAVGKSAAEADLPVVVTGDLNDVAWSETTRLFRKVSGLVDPRVGRGMYNTFHAKVPVLRWPLDHLFHSTSFHLVRIERLPAFGSDHFPIFVELQLTGERTKGAAGLEAGAGDELEAEEAMREEGVDERDVHTPGE